jgi:DNA-binding SARP family transcriptional activator
VLPSFELTDANASAVADVCRRLDGIPLAIELAAARVRMLSPEQLRDRLDDAFRVLGTGGRTAPPRHRTLRAAIDWSHDLLPADARMLFRRLSVFRGGFTLDAAEQVGVGNGIAFDDLLDLLGRLVDRSLVVAGEHGAETRYWLLETVRQYGAQQLTEVGEEEVIRSRHARWVLARAHEADPKLQSPERPLWLARLLPDLDNIRAALAWSHDADPELHVELVGALWWFWFSTQHWTEARRWLDGSLALPAAARPDRPRARVLFAAGALAALQVRPEASALLQEAIALARAVGDERLAIYATHYLGVVYSGAGKAEAGPLCAEAADWFRREDDLYGLRLALLLLGSTATYQGRLDEGLRFNEEGVAVARRFGLPRELAISLQNLAIVHLVAGRFDPAEKLVREALAAFLRDPSYLFIANGLSYLAEAAVGRGRPLEAARRLGAAESTRERLGARPFPRDAARLDAAVAACRATLDAATFERAWAEGRALSPEEAIRELGGAGASVPEPPAADLADATTADLVVSALGALALTVRGRAVADESWSYAKPKELLLWLLLRRAGGTRDEIGRDLWPDASPAQIKNSFHVTVHHLRKTLGGPEWIVAEGGCYRLNPDVTIATDWERFERAARAALAEGADERSVPDALALYTGDLLDGEPVGSWLLEERERLRALQVGLSMELGRRLEDTDPAAAAQVYHRIVLREDLNEEAHRRLMACWASAGERVRALRWYERLVDTLDSALQAEPEPETVQLYEQLRRG